MTREEREKAIDLLDNLVGMIEDNQGNDFALKKGIEALKEEPVIDKIRAEIKALSPEPTAEDVVDGNPTKDAVWEILIEVLKIIDKYDQSSSEIPTGSIYCQHTDEIAKSFIEDVESVKDQLPCSNQMDFPNTFDEFAKDYGFKDKDEVYTNGSELIPVFRVKQWLEHISTTKNNLGVEDEERTLALLYLEQIKEDYIEGEGYERHPLPEYYAIEKAIKTLAMPLVTPQKTKTGHWIGHREHCENLGVMPSGLGAYEWCSKCDCGIDVREWHRNHYNYCPNCGADMREVEE